MPSNNGSDITLHTRDKVEIDEVLADFGVVAIQQVSNGLNHAELLILSNLGHESEIKDCELAVVRSHHVSWVRVLRVQANEALKIAVES